MNVAEWSKSSVDYGRKLMNSALEGAREGEADSLNDERLAPYFVRSARHALGPAAIAASLGILIECVRREHRLPTRALAYGLAGGAIGFGAALIWENRKFSASVASHAWSHINRTRDEHWLEKNPIDYA